MKKKMLGLLAIGLLTGPTFAGAATIDFSTYGNLGTVVTNQFAGVGAIFSLQSISNDDYPGPIIDSFGATGTRGLYNTFNYEIPIIVSFTQSVRYATFDAALDFGLTAWAYDSSDGLLGSVTTFGRGGIAATSDIARLVFLNDTGVAYSDRTDLTAITQLCFSAIAGECQVPSVPEPGTLALLGLGLAGLGLSRRRKAN